MFRKNVLCLVALFIFALGLGISPVAVTQASAKTYTITALTAWPKNAFESQQFIHFLKNVQKEANQKYPGELKMVYKGANEVIRNREQVEACRNGLIDMVYTAGSYYTSILPSIDTMSLTTMEPWQERKAGVFKYLDKLHREKVGVHMLGRTGTGIYFHLFLAKPIANVADLKGMKIRVSPTNIPFMKALGAVPISMPPPDIYTAMERGVVDGYILPPSTIRDFGLVPVSKYYVVQPIYQACQFSLINLKVWNSLPKHLQDLLTENTIKLAHFNVANENKKNDSELAKAKKQGMVFINLPRAEAAKFKKMADDSLYNYLLTKAPVEVKKIREMITKN